jgi:hypothetical protein
MLMSRCADTKGTLSPGSVVPVVRNTVGLGEHQFGTQSSWVTRFVLAGCFASRCGGRTGRSVRFPPQFGHARSVNPATQSEHHVHSKVQMFASVDSGGRSRAQHSQFGLISNMHPVSTPTTRGALARAYDPRCAGSGVLPAVRWLGRYARSDRSRSVPAPPSMLRRLPRKSLVVPACARVSAPHSRRHICGQSSTAAVASTSTS